MAHGAARQYEKPEKVYALDGHKPLTDVQGFTSKKYEYHQRLQEQINLVERQKRV